MPCNATSHHSNNGGVVLSATSSRSTGGVTAGMHCCTLQLQLETDSNEEGYA